MVLLIYNWQMKKYIKDEYSAEEGLCSGYLNAKKMKILNL